MPRPSRTEFGKGAARRERRAGLVPAVLYGHGTEPRHISLPGHDVLLALRTANVLIRLEGLPGGSELALPKAVQRDPIKGTVEHVDLILVRRGEKVTVEVPVTVSGEVAPDGLLDQQLIQISVEAEATHIPPGIEVNVEDMAIGASVHAGDLELPQRRRRWRSSRTCSCCTCSPLRPPPRSRPTCEAPEAEAAAARERPSRAGGAAARLRGPLASKARPRGRVEACGGAARRWRMIAG